METAISLQVNMFLGAMVETPSQRVFLGLPGVLIERLPYISSFDHGSYVSVRLYEPVLARRAWWTPFSRRSFISS